jgi:hypothetical protein
MKDGKSIDKINILLYITSDMNFFEKITKRKDVVELAVPVGYKVRPRMEDLARILARPEEKLTKDERSKLVVAKAGLSMQNAIHGERFSLEDIVYVPDDSVHVIDVG